MQFNKVFQDWLTANKITKSVQEEFNLSFAEDIVIPVYDIEGNFIFNKYRRSPLSNEGPKYKYDRGGKVSLYGIHKAKDCNPILITEGEKDCLVAWSHNIPAVTSTGGAQSFQDEWKDYFLPKEDGEFAKDIIICYDNDHAGAEGLVKTLDILPWAKVMFIPDMPNVKDISDYVNVGGNLHELLKTARKFESIDEVTEDRSRRIATFQSVYFHDAYIKAHTKVANVHAERKTYSNDVVTNARAYPITNLMEFKKNTARCPFHNEKTPSLHYYPKTNTCYCFGGCGKSYDAIDIYSKLNGVKFREAVEQLNKLV